MNQLPSADPLLVAETVAALPARLRSKLDAAVAGAPGWTFDGSTVQLPGSVDVTLIPDAGVLRKAEHVVCLCLLAPACLHRAAVLAAAPVADADADASDEDRDAADEAPTFDWQPKEKAVARVVWQAASRLLASGVPGAGAAMQAELLRAVHLARLEGLHRLAAAATRVVAGVRSGRADVASYSLEQLTRDLLAVLEVCQAIHTDASDHAVWRGTARTVYEPVGGLRLTGLCMEPVVSAAGYAGVVVWLLDVDGRTWSVSDVKPGGPERVHAAASATVAIGEMSQTHRDLSRGGMVLSGATANAAGRLGAGSKVRAVNTAGSRWDEEPLLSQFGSARGLANHLLFLDLTICGVTDTDVLAADSAGNGLLLRAPSVEHTPIFRDNLRLLGGVPGLRLLAVGRPSTRQVGTVELLAVGGRDLQLPDSFGGHADLGIDQLSRAFLAPSGQVPAFVSFAETADPVTPLRRRLERVVAGGGRTLSMAGSAAGIRSDIAAIRRAQLGAGADVVESLVAAAQPDTRDVFGRLLADDPDALARAWLAAAVYERSFVEALHARQWADLAG